MSHPNPEIWWRHRRRGYYFGIIWTIVSTFIWIGLELFRPNVLDSLGVVIGWSYGFSTTLIIAYYGNTAVEEFSKNKKH